jgi:hypothetical protein
VGGRHRRLRSSRSDVSTDGKLHLHEPEDLHNMADGSGSEREAIDCCPVRWGAALDPANGTGVSWKSPGFSVRRPIASFS